MPQWHNSCSDTTSGGTTSDKRPQVPTQLNAVTLRPVAERVPATLLDAQLQTRTSQQRLLTMYLSCLDARTFVFPLFTLGCREHFVSGRWHSSGRDYSRYPRECWLCTLGVLHPGVPVMGSAQSLRVQRNNARARARTV